MWKVIGRGRAGWHASAGNTSSSGGSLEHYLKEGAEGALVYDADHLEGLSASRYYQFVVNGPMPDSSLAPDEGQRFSDSTRERAARMIPGMSGAFEALASAAQDPAYTGLDRVGLNIYESLLRKIPGIKIGHVRSGVVVWA